MQVLNNEFKQEIRNITKLSAEVNGDDKQKILSMMKDHIDEITELYEKNNDHYQVETADLIVLSFELLLLENKDIDMIFAKCLPRFYKKLNELKSQKNKEKL